MDKKTRGLKDVLIEDSLTKPTAIKEMEKVKLGEAIEEIDLILISPNPFQPRRFFDAEKITELAQSIKTHGVIQPIILRPVNDGYMIIAGERRYRAALEAGLNSIPAVIRNYDTVLATTLSLIENLQREDLSAIEEAESYQMMMRTMGLTHGQLAERLAKSRSHVTNVLGLLNLPEDIQKMLSMKQLTMGHARVLSKLEDPKRIKELALKILREGLSVRQIELMAQSEKKAKAQKKKEKPVLFLEYEHKLKQQLGYNVNIGKKSITINYKGEEELQDLLEVLLK